MMDGAPGSSFICPVVHVVRGPTTLGNTWSDGGKQAHGGKPGIPAFGHGRAAGVVLHALDGDAELPDRDDPRDDGGAVVGAFEMGALLDVEFEVAAVAVFLGGDPGKAGQPGGGEGVAQR